MSFLACLLLLPLACLPAAHGTYNGVDCHVFNDFYHVPISFVKNLNASNPRDLECLLKLHPTVWGSLSWRVCMHMPAEMLVMLFEKIPNFRSLIFQDEICHSASETATGKQRISNRDLPSARASASTLTWPCHQVQESVRDVWISCGLCSSYETWLRYFRWIYRLRIFLQARLVDIVIAVCFINYEMEMVSGLSDICEDVVKSALQQAWGWLMFYVNLGQTILKDFFSQAGILAINTVVSDTLEAQDPKAARAMSHVIHAVEKLGSEGQALDSGLEAGASSVGGLAEAQRALAASSAVDIERQSGELINKLSLAANALHSLIKLALRASPKDEFAKQVGREEHFVEKVQEPISDL